MAYRFVPVIHGAALDRPDEQDTIDTAATIAQSLERLGFSTEVITVGTDLIALDRLAERRPYAVFNLVEALGGEAARGAEAVRRVERLGLACTGAGGDAYVASNGKLTTKALLAERNIPMPASWMTGEDVPAWKTVIVKSVDEHGSLGMDAGSVVSGSNAQTEFARREACFGGRFFAEEYIEGREFNVSVIESRCGPGVLPIAEIDFSGLPSGTLPIVDFAAKWDASADAYHNTPRRFGLDREEPDLAAELQRLSLESWQALGLSGYARVDFRVNSHGAIYVLEANANPCLAADAGFAAAASQAGLAYDDVISSIVDVAAQNSKASL